MTFKPEIFNGPFTLVVLFNIVNPLTFIYDDNVVLIFDAGKRSTYIDDRKSRAILYYKKNNH